MKVNKLRGKMAENGYTLTTMSDRLSISRATLNNYLKNPNKMPYEIIEKMADLLFDTKEEAFAVFFN